MKEEPGPLEAFTTADLLKEVSRRCDTFVFAGQYRATNEVDNTILRVVGNTTTALGLVEVLRREVWEEHEDTACEPAGDDE